jgi:hypothetical protein
MNESSTSATYVPPIVGSAPRESRAGDDPNDRVPITGWLGMIEAVLRHPRRLVYQLSQDTSAALVWGLVALGVAFIAVYGVIVGSFSGGVQWTAAPAKMAIGLVITAVICLPSLYVFACLSGCEARLGQVAGALAGCVALTTLLMIGFAPVGWLFSQSTTTIGVIGALHLLFWLIALRFGVRFLLGALRHLGVRSNVGLYTWVAIFLLVSLQMSTALRPLLGTAETLLPETKKFFVAHWLDAFALDGR